MKKTHYILFILVFFISCGDDNQFDPEPEILQRTIIAYLCGDNNLSLEINVKIDALQKGMQKMGETNNRLVVYSDIRDHMPQLWEITATGKKLLKEYTEMNSASPANFNKIIKEVMSDFPAESYGLICFSHASGWLPKGALDNPVNFASKRSGMQLKTIFDDNGSEMPLDEFANAIPLPENGDKFEFIIFETCYMAGIEVAWELRNKTKYIVASSAEMLSPGLIEIYPDHLSDLYAPTPNLKTFSEAYFNHWDEQRGALRSATISVLNLSEINVLADVVKDIYADQAKTTDISSLQHFNRNAGVLFFDFSDYIQSIANEQQYTSYLQAMSNIVEYRQSTSQFMVGYPFSFNIKKHCGLTTYIIQEKYSDLNKAYLKLSWAQTVKTADLFTFSSKYNIH